MYSVLLLSIFLIILLVCLVLLTKSFLDMRNTVSTDANVISDFKQSLDSCHGVCEINTKYSEELSNKNRGSLRDLHRETLSRLTRE